MNPKIKQCLKSPYTFAHLLLAWAACTGHYHLTERIAWQHELAKNSAPIKPPTHSWVEWQKDWQNLKNPNFRYQSIDSTAHTLNVKGLALSQASLIELQQKLTRANRTCKLNTDNANYPILFSLNCKYHEN